MTYSAFDPVADRIKTARAGAPQPSPFHADEALVPAGALAALSNGHGDGLAVEPAAAAG